MKILLHSRKFWIAVVGLAVIIINTLFPQFPKPLFDAFYAAAIAIISIYTVQDSVAYLRGIYPRGPPGKLALADNPIERLWQSQEFKTALVGLFTLILTVGFQFPPAAIQSVVTLFAWLIGAQAIEGIAYRLGYRASK